MASAISTRQQQFGSAVWAYYRTHSRYDLPWRQPDATGQFNPYHILVSEVMLQQTQVSRVVPKYYDFIATFPDPKTLAEATLAEVLAVWSGLGYNRRAKFLWQSAVQLHTEATDIFPHEVDALERLPGIGYNTAGAIAAYAFNKPVVFVETNIRTVIIHHFFADQTQVTDKQLVPILQAALEDLPKDQTPRTWYWALMDYGTHLKQTVGNSGRQSASYKKQSKFEGSRRQIRGRIIGILAESGASTESDLSAAIVDDRLAEVLTALAKEGFIRFSQGHYHLRTS